MPYSGNFMRRKWVNPRVAWELGWVLFPPLRQSIKKRSWKTPPKLKPWFCLRIIPHLPSLSDPVCARNLNSERMPCFGAKQDAKRINVGCKKTRSHPSDENGITKANGRSNSLRRHCYSSSAYPPITVTFLYRKRRYFGAFDGIMTTRL